MARPRKEGLDYFPLDTVIDDKTELLEAKHGLAGFAIIIKLYQKIYKNGYYYSWGEDEKLLFCRRNDVTMELLDSVMVSALKYKIFDNTMYESGVLTSTEIQQKYFEAVKRRKDQLQNAPYIIHEQRKMEQKQPLERSFCKENNTETAVNVSLTPQKQNTNDTDCEVIAKNGEQRKEKESKEKESKEKEIKVNESTVHDDSQLPDFLKEEIYPWEMEPKAINFVPTEIKQSTQVKEPDRIDFRLVLETWNHIKDAPSPGDLFRFQSVHGRDILPLLTGLPSKDYIQAIRNYGIVKNMENTWWNINPDIMTWTRKHIDRFLPQNFKQKDFEKSEPEDKIDWDALLPKEVVTK